MAIKTLKVAFRVRVGYSDHTPGMEVPIAAAAMGAEVIEKHITLDKNMMGPDHKASMEPVELVKMVECIRNIEKALGDGLKFPTGEELKVREAARKYIVTNRLIYRGQTISSDMLCIKRAGSGFEPKHMDSIIGSIAAKDLPEGHILQKGDFCMV
jgi:N,N'-diacetyllegionaminate synthase